MEKLSGLLEWISRKWNSIWKRISGSITNSDVKARFQIEFVEDTPDTINEKTIFIVQDGNLPELLVFECPCGCKASVILNLLPDATPKWSYSISKKGIIDVYPSIWRKVGCKSHFFVRQSSIDWA
jgi:hypothetical protein